MNQFSLPCFRSSLPTVTEDPAAASRSGFPRNSCRFSCAHSWPTQDHRCPAHGPPHLQCPDLVHGPVPWLFITVTCESPEHPFRHPFLAPHSPYHPWSISLASLTWPFPNVMVSSTFLMLRSPYSPTVPRLLVSVGLPLGITFSSPYNYTCLVTRELNWTKLSPCVHESKEVITQ